MNNLMTVYDVAKLLHVSPDTVRRMIKRGDLIAYKIGKSWRVYEEDLHTCIKRNTNQWRFGDE